MPDYGETLEAKDQALLYNFISIDGEPAIFRMSTDMYGRQNTNMIVDGSLVAVSSGTWTCGRCFSREIMYYVDSTYGFIRCDSDDLTCIQDAEEKRGVMAVYHSVKPMGIRGFVFFR